MAAVGVQNKGAYTVDFNLIIDKKLVKSFTDVPVNKFNTFIVDNDADWTIQADLDQPFDDSNASRTISGKGDAYLVTTGTTCKWNFQRR